MNQEAELGWSGTGDACGLSNVPTFPYPVRTASIICSHVAQILDGPHCSAMVPAWPVPTQTPVVVWSRMQQCWEVGPGGWYFDQENGTLVNGLAPFLSEFSLYIIKFLIPRVACHKLHITLMFCFFKAHLPLGFPMSKANSRAIL